MVHPSSSRQNGSKHKFEVNSCRRRGLGHHIKRSVQEILMSLAKTLLQISSILPKRWTLPSRNMFRNLRMSNKLQ
eukprot:2293912-Amphidinium_carterae.1